MNKPIVFLRSDPEDAFSGYVWEHFAHHPAVKLVEFEEIARHLQPTPWPQVVTASYPDDLIDTFRDAHVINRVFNIDPDIVQSGLLAHGPHELWLHVITQPLLNSAASLAHDMGTRGVSRSLPPLNTQWLSMSDAGRNGIKVPHFVFGFGGADPDVSGVQNSMQKSIWSYFDWKVERHLPRAEKGWHKFFVESPAGEPVICHYLGAHTWQTFPRGQALDLDEEQMASIIARARICFASSIGEVLLYLEEGGQLRFHAFSPHLSAAVQSEAFPQTVERWIEEMASIPVSTARHHWSPEIA